MFEDEFRPTNTIFSSASGLANGATISWGIYNELNASGNQLTISINAGSSNGVYDVINFPAFALTDVTVAQNGIDRYTSTPFGASRVSFDAHNFFLDIAGSWNVYDTRLILSVAGASSVPEPASLTLLAGMLLGGGLLRRRARR